MTVPYAVTVFEYCLVSRIDCLDVLIGLRPAMIDTVCEKITENFHQQSPGVQQLFQNQLLALKMAIYRYFHVFFIFPSFLKLNFYCGLLILKLILVG